MLILWLLAGYALCSVITASAWALFATLDEREMRRYERRRRAFERLMK